jgi:hypothetical protein
METYRYPGNEAISFEADVLGDGNSAVPGKDRWGSATILRLDEGTYAVALCGHSIVTGETDRWHMHIFNDATDALKAMVRGRYLPRHCYEAAEKAATVDPLIDEALASYDEAVSWGR